LSAEHGSINRPVVIGGRVVTPGDLVIGDDDGLVH
jgi:regulator of RNase E activity RraA